MFIHFNRKLLSKFLMFAASVVICLQAQANGVADLQRLKRAYPDHILSISKQRIVWKDGTDWKNGVIFWGYNDDTKKYFPVKIRFNSKNVTLQKKLDSPSLTDQVLGVRYTPGIPRNPATFTPKGDPGRIRYEPFFRKMYGNSPAEVAKHLVEIEWMPHVFQNERGQASYHLLVTTVNGVNEKLKLISNELETLVEQKPEYKDFLKEPGGTFKWRIIANTNRLSNHSFGMTIDINVELSDYWQYDLKKEDSPITEIEPLTYHNRIPWEIVLIFEKHGFIWGGKWHHYDTMHFEYRPELL